MATLYSLHREKSLLAAKRKQFLGREFTIGLVTGIVVAIEPAGKSFTATFIGTRWKSPGLFRWPRRIRRWDKACQPHTYIGTRQQGTPLPDHAPRHYGIHMLDRPA